MILSDQDFARLRLLLSRTAGLVFDDARRESLAYSVAERLRATGLSGAAAYLDLVELAGSSERQQLLDEVTIQETHFFRNPPQVRALREHVLPELVRAAADGRRRLRIWSAGCSTGEEPYSIAMLLRELLPSTDGWDVKVVATDVSERALEAARVGCYGARAVQLATPDELARFFLVRPDGRYEVRREVRELVEFRHHNLVTAPPPVEPGEQLDLVLCRNVTIYFSRDTTRALVGRVHDALRDGGYLFLGHSETLWQVNDAFRLVTLGSGDGAAFVYRRLDDATLDGARRPGLIEAPVPAAGPDDGSTLRHAWRGLTRGRTPPLRPSIPAQQRVDVVRPDPRTPPADAATALADTASALADGRYAEAAELAAAIAATDPLAAAAHRLQGEALVALGQDGGALVCLRKALYLDPDDAMAHFLLAGALARCGHAAAAAREYRATADVLARRPGGTPAPELEGRDVDELVSLCHRLGAQLEGRLSAAGEVA